LADQHLNALNDSHSHNNSQLSNRTNRSQIVDNINLDPEPEIVTIDQVEVIPSPRKWNEIVKSTPIRNNSNMTQYRDRNINNR